MNIKPTKRIGRFAVAVAGLSVTALMLSACAGGSSPAANSGSASGAATGTDPAKFSALFTTENSQTPAELTKLSQNQCAAENAKQPLDLQATPSANMAQKLQLLAGQGDLPLIYQAGNSHIVPGGDFEKSGQVLDIQAALTAQGVGDQITPIAQSTINQIFQNTDPTIPFQFNIEGIFYNKKLFADNNIAIPTTYDDLLAAAAKFKAIGITPFTASGATGWTISRWIGVLLFRELGPDAMVKIQNGTAKLTDPQYVKAAQQLADMGAKGYFPDGVTNLDYPSAQAQLLNGNAAMMYLGTWFLQQINDPSLNKEGDNIAFMPFPNVAGGAGSIDQYPANAGGASSINPKLYGPNTAAWLKCIAENYGSASLADQGTLSGFKVSTPVTTIPAITQDVQSKVDATKQSVLWFEALFGQKATTDASNNAAPLLTGAMSPQDYMAALQADLAAK